MKKLFVLLAVIAMSMCSQAAYLLWQITSEDITNAGLVEGSSVTHATLYAFDTTQSEAHKIGTMKIDSAERTVDLGSYSTANYVYYVEVYNWNDSTRILGTSFTANSSGEQSYTSMVGANYIGTSLSAVPTLQVWHGGGVAAPEPTSAMMILLGLAGFALKRKKV